jgi:hypothetical protein
LNDDKANKKKVLIRRLKKMMIVYVDTKNVSEVTSADVGADGSN